MSSTASNYDVSKLIIGQVVAFLALILGVITLSFNEVSPKAVLPFSGITLLYGVMMFASSYVEEEQNFWYWSSTAWLVLLWVKG